MYEKWIIFKLKQGNVNMPALFFSSRYCNKFMFYLRWFDTVFSGPHLAFSIGILPTFPWSYRCENQTSFLKGIEVWLKIDIA